MHSFVRGNIIQSKVNGTVALVTAISILTHRLFCIGSDGRTFSIDEEDTNRWNIIGKCEKELDNLLLMIKENEEG